MFMLLLFMMFGIPPPIGPYPWLLPPIVPLLIYPMIFLFFMAGFAAFDGEYWCYWLPACTSYELGLLLRADVLALFA
jgi:hypothetical protein